MGFILLIFIWIIGIVFLIISGYLRKSANLEREKFGIPPGEIKYIDSVRVVKPKVLYSNKYRLKGKPDMIILQDNQFIPIEHKPTSNKVFDNHIMQLMAYCLLVEEVYKIRPDYGILVLKDGKKEKIKFTDERREKLIDVLEEMREIISKSKMPYHFIGKNKCRSCGYEKFCRNINTSAPSDALT